MRPTIAVALLLGYAAAALYPYEWNWPTLPNSADRDSTGVLVFFGNGIAHSQLPPMWITAGGQPEKLEVALRVRTYSGQQSGPARVLTISRDPYHRNLTVAQDGEDLVLRLRTPLTDPNGMPAHRVAAVFADPGWKDIGILVEPEKLTIEVDGEPRYAESLPDAPLSTWDPTFQLALGNELTLDRPWQGEIERATLRTDDSEVDYTTQEALVVPDFLWLLERPKLTPFRDITLNDALLHFLGFIPLGLLLWYGERRGRTLRFVFLLTLIVCFGTVLEVLQLGVAGRHASVNDLMLSAAGGFTGLLLMSLLSHRRSSPQPSRSRPST